MAYSRRRPGMKKRGMRKRPAKKYGYKRRIGNTSTRTFTECFKMESPVIQTNSGGILKVQANSLPEWSSYSALYNQYCIKRLQFILIPRYGQVDMNNAVAGVDYYQNRITYSVQESPYVLAPANEQQVLEDNGCKFALLTDKKLVITVNRPTPDISVQTSAQLVADNTRKLRWFNTSNSEVLATGGGIPHGTVQWWCSNNLLNVPYQVADLYVRMTISFRDPA